MSLTDTSIRNAKPKPKPYKLHDRDGLFILVHPNGSRYWRFKYSFLGKEKLLALGVYPEVSLAEARERLAQARKAVAAGTDPSEAKKAAKRLAILNSQTTYEAIAREWHEQRKHKWTPGYAASALVRLEHHMFPKLGNRPIADIDPAELLSVVRIVEKSGALDMAQRVMQLTGQIFSYAIATGRAKRNPVTDLRGALKPPVRKHMAYIKANELPEYLKNLELAHIERNEVRAAYNHAQYLPERRKMMQWWADYLDGIKRQS